jgi:transposase InsO family protein
MNKAGLYGVSRRRRVITTVRDGAAKPASDLVERNFTAAAPDRLWVADITYIPTWAGFLYLAVVLDAFSRKIVGWAMETHLRTELVLAALNMALGQRRPRGVIHHSDHGSQYTALAFGKRCDEAGVRPSMGSVGDCFDNAMCESFFATLECELLDRTSFKTQAEARMAVFDFIEGLCDMDGENVAKLTGSSGGGSPYRGLRIMPRVTRWAPSSGVRGLARYPGTKLDSRTDKQEYEHRLRGPRNERWEVKG